METKTFQVPAIGCNGCVRTIQNELGDLAGVMTVDGSVETRMVTVTWDQPASWEQIKTTLVEIEYPPAEASPAQ
jgi:copper chaperone CopZ